MDKRDILAMISNLENKMEKSKILLYQKTDGIIERLNAVHDQQDEIDKIQREIEFINKRFDKYLESLKID